MAERELAVLKKASTREVGGLVELMAWLVRSYVDDLFIRPAFRRAGLGRDARVLPEASGRSQRKDR